MSPPEGLTAPRLGEGAALGAREARGGILVAGLGSIGRCHLRSLLALDTRRPLCLYRSGHGATVEPGWRHLPVHGDLTVALAQRHQAVIVAGPTALHLPVALQAARAGCHLLIEKPLGHSLDGVAELRAEVERQRLHVLVGYQLRLHPTLRRVRDWIATGAIGRVVSAEAHWGEALPDWHPEEDYRRGYSARRELGGGAVLTLSHPLDYLRFLLGDVVRVAAETAQLSGLELEVEDVAHLTLRFASGVLASVHVDYVERPAAHWLRVVGRHGVILWNGADGVAELHRALAPRPERVAPPPGFTRASLFLDEMRHFLDCLAGDAPPACSLADGVAALEIALAALRSAAERRTVDL